MKSPATLKHRRKSESIGSVSDQELDSENVRENRRQLFSVFVFVKEVCGDDRIRLKDRYELKPKVKTFSL